MRRRLLVTLVPLLAGLAVGAPGAAAQGKVTVKYANEVDTRHPYYRAAEFMAKRAAELSRSRGAMTAGVRAAP